MGTVISFTFCKHIFIEFSFISGGSFTRTTGEVRNEKKSARDDYLHFLKKERKSLKSIFHHIFNICMLYGDYQVRSYA